MSSPDPLLVVKDLQRTLGDRLLWRGIGLTVHKGDVWFVRGPSGVGKTLFLRALSCLDPVEGGQMWLRGKSPSEVGIPCWRAQVLYVHQQRVNYPGTPLQFFERVQSLAAQKGRPRGDLHALVEEMGLEQGVLTQKWSELSGGQAQRVALAVSIALQPEVLLLDEPTSACDTDAALRVEAVLKHVARHAAIVWVTHDEQQPHRVGGKVLQLPTGMVSSVSRAADLGGHSSQQDSSQALDRSATWAGPGTSSLGSFIRRQDAQAAVA